MCAKERGNAEGKWDDGGRRENGAPASWRAKGGDLGGGGAEIAESKAAKVCRRGESNFRRQNGSLYRRSQGRYIGTCR